MDKVYVFFANGFEEIEGLTVVDILRRGQVETVMVSITGNDLVTGSHGISVKTDCLFEESDLSDGTLYVLPGGMPGTRYLGEHEGLGRLLADAKMAGKRVAAICAAPSVLGQLGLLQGETAVCYPGFEERLKGAVVTENEVEISGQITTSRGMGTASPFALALLGQLKGEDAAAAMGRSLIWRRSEIL